MENTDKETQDFMKVEYFSQLPFIRPPVPPKEKSIRLFGHEFSGVNTSTATTTTTTTTTTSSSSSPPPPQANVNRESKDNETEENTSRKFECHYCCRNFPTSQALGGHQNAHKRERQMAKRAHLHSAAMAHAGLSDFYGLPNYHRLTSALPPPYHYGYNNNITSTSSRLLISSPSSYYNSDHPSYNGSALGAMWRIPSRDRNPQCYTREASANQPQMRLNQSRVVFEPKPSMPDNVSLDLHL